MFLVIFKFECKIKDFSVLPTFGFDILAMSFGITLKIVKNAESGFLHHARKPPFSFYMAIENTSPIAEMRFMLFFIELRFMFFFVELFYNPKLIFYFTSFFPGVTSF